jgi:hypothetical protein
MKEHRNGTKFWLINGKVYREDGLVVEEADGVKEWRINGELHREDGPAIEFPDGTKLWFIKGELHRENGPAAEFANGSKEYWFIGERIRKLEYRFIKLMKALKIENFKLVKKMVKDEPEMYSSWLMSL